MTNINTDTKPIDVKVSPEVMEVAAEPIKVSRQHLRDTVFSKVYTELKKEEVNFNGVLIELRQMTVENISLLQSEGKNFIVQVLIHSGYIPGTDEKVFEPADYDSLVAMPASPSYNRLTEAVNNLFSSGVDEKVGK